MYVSTSSATKRGFNLPASEDSQPDRWVTQDPGATEVWKSGAYPVCRGMVIPSSQSPSKRTYRLGRTLPGLPGW